MISHRSPAALLRPVLCLCAVLLLSACCVTKPAVSQIRETFEPDGKGGIFFEDAHITQERYPRLQDAVIEGLLEEAGTYFFLHYPHGLGEKADAAVRKKAEAVFGRSVLGFYPDSGPQPADPAAPYAEAPEEVAGEESAPEPQVYPLMITYIVTETGKNAMSVMFRSWDWHGGAHENWTYSGLSLDRRTGERITLARLFTGPRSLERTAHWLSDGERATYRYASCATADPTTEHPWRIAVNLEDISMDRIRLTPEGLELLFAPYEKGSFAMGDLTARVPLQEFKRLGISREFWDR